VKTYTVQVQEFACNNDYHYHLALATTNLDHALILWVTLSTQFYKVAFVTQWNEDGTNEIVKGVNDKP